MVLFGASGSGKSVLLKTGIGLIQADEGHVRLFGRDITALSEEKLLSMRRCVGMLFQEGGLFDSLTVEENVAYPLEYPQRKLPEPEVRARVKQALDFVGLSEALDRLPSDLSGGMRRRIGIARAEVTKPPLMLYDSPTAGLDPVTAYRIVALVIQQRDTRSATTIVVTHRYQDGRLLANYTYDPTNGKLKRTSDLSQRVKFIVLRDGRVTFEGSEAGMRASADPYVASFAGIKKTVSP